MPSIINLKATGLNTVANALDAPEGSLVEATNVVIDRDNIVEQRRGFKLFAESFGSASDRAKQLAVYRGRILRHFASTLQFQDGINNDGIVNFSNFSGTISEVQAGLRMKFIESNGNLFFTTSDGIKKISASSADQLSTNSDYINNAGGVKALDVTGRLKITLGDQTGFLPADAAVAYRVVWGITDANNNLILGTPSSRAEIYNPLEDLLFRDFLRLLGALDNINDTGSLIDDGDYIDTLALDNADSALDLRNNLISLATKIDEDILYADNDGAPTGAPLEIDTATITSGVCTITFASGDPTLYLEAASKIFLSGFTPTTGTLDGAQVVSTVTSTTITFNTSATGPVVVGGGATIVSNEYRSITQPAAPSLISTNTELVDIQTYISEIMLRLQSEPDGVIPTALLNTYIIPLDVTNSATVELDIIIPDNVTSNHFYQVYRSSIAQAQGAISIGDITPSDELQLVIEGFPTQVELDARLVTIQDITPDEFRGTNLYTNAASGEGILQSNDVPPLAKDINKFKNTTFYANTKTKHKKNFSLLGVSNLIEAYNLGNIPKLVITNENSSNTYDFIVGEAEETDIECTDGSTLENGANPGTYFLLNSANNINKYYVWYQVGSSTDPAISGRIGIEVKALAGDTDAQVASKTENALKQIIQDFTVSVVTNTVTVINNDVGYTDDAEIGTSSFTITITNQGQGEKVTRETSIFTCVADVANSLAGTYFTINTAFNREQYYVWYEVSGNGTDPAVANKIGIKVELTTGDAASVVAVKTKAELDTLTEKFIVSAQSADLTIQNYKFGPANNATVGTSGFSLEITEQGALEILLSNLASPARAVDETARSLVKAINTNGTEIVYGFYLSGPQDIPGKFLLEARDLNDIEFYVVTDSESTGESFNPDLSPEISISSITTGSPSTMTVVTSSAHGLLNSDYVIISNSDSTPNIDGLYQITLVNSTTFRINATITNAGTTGSIIKAVNAIVSENETKVNRIYYSKLLQPEAVPIVNFLDVGSSDKEILRIFPLRDSLFVFKEDGLYRISGESSPFVLSLFDSSCILLAPDSVDVLSNIVYCWTTQGISAVSEAGVNNISRPIEPDITPLASAAYTNFKTATFGVAYESDNSYLVWTVQETDDEEATLCYRFNNITYAWTTFDKTNTCGLINPVDDKMYLGAGDTNYIEVERKDFARTDYADRELSFDLIDNNYYGDTLKLLSVADIEVGDVVVQEQRLTAYEYNSLLQQLDTDGDIDDNDYFTSLEMVGGDNPRDKIEDLANKLDADAGIIATDFFTTIDSKTGTITNISVANPTVITTASHGLQTGRIINISGSNSTPSINGLYQVTVIDNNTFSIPVNVTGPGTAGSWSTLDSNFKDIEACYNAIIRKLNTDAGVSFNNYQEIDTISNQEAVITEIHKNAKEIVLNLELDFMTGPIIIYKAIRSSITYSPVTMGDALGLKHIREATMMFTNKAFTSATLSFSTDLLPLLQPVPFNGSGNGIFGHQPFGSNYFGGISHSAPFRTYVPRNCQRCRFLNCKFTHNIARESYAIYGLTLTGEIGQSSRAYR